MKTSTLVLAALLLISTTSHARILASTVTYEGHPIAHFELPEVEITGKKILKGNVPTSNNETIRVFELPEVVITDYYITPVQPKGITSIDNNTTKAEAVKQVAMELNASGEVKKPFLHKIANSIYETGYRVLQTVAEGLFFRS